MSFKSKSQQRWMFANKPGMAERWADHTPDIKALPEKTGSLDLILAKMAEMDKGALAAWQRPENADIVAKSLGMNPAELETAMAKQQLAKATGPVAGPSMLAQERASIQAQNARIEQMRTAPKTAPNATSSPAQPHPGAELRQKGFTSKRPPVSPSHVAPPNTPSPIQGGPTMAQSYGTRFDKAKDWWRRLGVGKQRNIRRGGIGGAALGLGGVGLYNLMSGNEKGASSMKKTAEEIAMDVLTKVAGGTPAQIAMMQQQRAKQKQQNNAQTMRSTNSALGAAKPAPVPSALTGGPPKPAPGMIR